MEIISAHPPHPPLFAFISLLETRLGSSRSGGEGGEATSRRRSPRPARRLHGPGSTAAGRARLSAGRGRAGPGRRPPGQGAVEPGDPGPSPPPSAHTHTHTHARFGGPVPPAAGALPEGAVRDSPHARSTATGRGHLQLRTPK